MVPPELGSRSSQSPAGRARSNQRTFASSSATERCAPGGRVAWRRCLLDGRSDGASGDLAFEGTDAGLPGVAIDDGGKRFVREVGVGVDLLDVVEVFQAFEQLQGLQRLLAQVQAFGGYAIGNHDLMACQADSTSVSFFNLPPMQQVVPEQQARLGHPSVAMRLTCVMNPWHVEASSPEGAECLRKVLLSQMAHGLHAPPQLRCSLLNLLHQCTFGTYRVIQSR